jgi:hypothetical protein
MSDLDVTAHETGVVRLFQLDLPEDEIRGFVEKGWYPGDDGGEAEHWPLREALGAEYLKVDHVEVFPVGDVAALGLSTYMTEGLGMPDAEIAADKSRIDAVRGHVVVVTSAAFGGVAQRLDPHPPLHLIGTYRETPPAPVIGTIETASANGRMAKRSGHVVHARNSTLRNIGIVFLAMLLGAGIVVALALGLG